MLKTEVNFRALPPGRDPKCMANARMMSLYSCSITRQQCREDERDAGRMIRVGYRSRSKTPLHWSEILDARLQLQEWAYSIVPGTTPELFCIEAWEEGGAFEDTKGEAQIVCSGEGKMLNPLNYSGLTGDMSRACMEHACFLQTTYGSHVTMVTIIAQWRAEVDHSVRVCILNHSLDSYMGRASIHTEILYEGCPDSLPKSFDCFTAAVQAAVAKAMHPGCMECHYALLSK